MLNLSVYQPSPQVSPIEDQKIIIQYSKLRVSEIMPEFLLMIKLLL